MLQRDGVVKVAKLMEIFQVSIETIRRDLEALEKLGVLTRVYGGATGDLIAAFLKESPISKDEVERLRSMLDDMEV